MTGKKITGEKGKGITMAGYERNPYKYIDIGCVFKDFYVEFKHTDPNRPKELCPYGNHELRIAENINEGMFFDVRIDFMQISFWPQTPTLILTEEKCRECGKPIKCTLLPLPPSTVWTKESWTGFYSGLLGSDFKTSKRYEALRSYIRWGVPFRDFGDIIKETYRVAEKAMYGEIKTEE